MRLSNALVAMQMALCVMLLAGAGLTIRSAVYLYSAPIGANTGSVLTMRVNLPEGKTRHMELGGVSQGAGEEIERDAGRDGDGNRNELPLSGWSDFDLDAQGKKFDPSRVAPGRWVNR